MRSKVFVVADICEVEEFCASVLQSTITTYGFGEAVLKKFTDRMLAEQFIQNNDEPYSLVLLEVFEMNNHKLIER